MALTYMLETSETTPRQYRVVVASGGPSAMMFTMLELASPGMRVIGVYDTVPEVMDALEAFLNMEPT